VPKLTHLLPPPHAAKREPNVGQPKSLGNISDIRCRICRHWFIIAQAGLCSMFLVRVHLSSVWASASAACRRPWVLLGPASFSARLFSARSARGAQRPRCRVPAVSVLARGFRRCCLGRPSVLIRSQGMSGARLEWGSGHRVWWMGRGKGVGVS